MREIKAVSPEVRFVYTYRMDAAGKVTFVVDAEDAPSPDVSHVGDDYAAAHPGDQPVALMLERSRQFLANPPPAAWQGEFVMDSK